ncbi:RNA polymerase sigma factor, sigma-70 family [bacterium A37T11]|nr:RNA polymerase sigma factor, sigma-70 family [bacterium A37T11]
MDEINFLYLWLYYGGNSQLCLYKLVGIFCKKIRCIVMIENLDQDRDWVEFIAGNKEAFCCLYNNHIDKLVAYGKCFTHDIQMIEDCIHDLFLDLDRYRERLNPEVNVAAYMAVSLRRKIFSAIKKSRNFKAIEECSLDESRLMDDANVETARIGKETDMYTFYQIKRELENLPWRQQQAIHLKFILELSYEELSEIMEISVSTSRTLVYRGIKRLRQKAEGLTAINFVLLTVMFVIL